MRAVLLVCVALLACVSLVHGQPKAPITDNPVWDAKNPEVKQWPRPVPWSFGSSCQKQCDEAAFHCVAPIFQKKPYTKCQQAHYPCLKACVPKDNKAQAANDADSAAIKLEKWRYDNEYTPIQRCTMDCLRGEGRFYNMLRRPTEMECFGTICGTPTLEERKAGLIPGGCRASTGCKPYCLSATGSQIKCPTLAQVKASKINVKRAAPASSKSTGKAPYKLAPQSRRARAPLAPRATRKQCLDSCSRSWAACTKRRPGSRTAAKAACQPAARSCAGRCPRK